MECGNYLSSLKLSLSKIFNKYNVKQNFLVIFIFKIADIIVKYIKMISFH